MTDSRRGRRPTPGQKRARQKRDEAGASHAARKKRTRELIQLGGVCAHYGFTSPGQVDELMAALSKRGAWVEWLAKRGVDLRDNKPER